jgi:hypothetical protein
MKADSLLLTPGEVAAALGSRAEIQSTGTQAPGQSIGDVVRAAASDSAYRHFRGVLTVGENERPLAAGIMALVFDAESKAERTFTQVAQAAHLRTELEGCNVAVETVTASSGLVSYWGFVQRGVALVIVTIDTLDPQQVSVADLRSLVAATAVRLDQAGSRH